MLRWCMTIVKKHTTAHQHWLRYCATRSQKPRLKPVGQSSSFNPYNLILICPVTCFCLCYWQIRRKEWKLNLIGTLESRLNADVQPLPENWSEMDDLYPVSVRGHFDYTNEVYIGPRNQNNQQGGVHVITPFVLSDRNLTILVNRGFYSRSQFKNDSVLENGQHLGEREIVGYIRKDQENLTNLMMMMDLETPSTIYGHDTYPVRKLDLLAKRCGTSQLFLDAKDLGPTPQNAPIHVKPGADLRDKHQEYAIFWFMLGCCCIFLYGKGKVKRTQKEITSVKDFVEKRAGSRRQ